ncbi:MAG: hypothetical protein P8176_08230 [Gammaproteobacteria bacterium]
MPSNWIIPIMSVGIAGIFAALYIVSSLERIRTNRSIKIGTWQDRAHRLQHLLAASPPNALTHAVKQAGYTEIQRCLLEVLKLNSHNSTARKRLTEVNEALKKLPSEPPATLKLDPIRTLDELKEVRQQLTNLFNFVHIAAKTKRLDVTAAKQELDILKNLFTEAGVSYYLNAAKAEENQKKYHAALHHYKMALGEYKKSNTNNLYKEHITAIQNAVADLELRQQDLQNAMSHSATNNLLASAVDEMQNDEDALWQKKKF